MICIKFILLHRRKAFPSVSLKCTEGYIKSTTKILRAWKEAEIYWSGKGKDVQWLNNHVFFETDSDDA